MRTSFLEHFMADARRYVDKKYPTHGPFSTRNRDRFFVKVEQGLKVRQGLLAARVALMFRRGRRKSLSRGVRASSHVLIVLFWGQLLLYLQGLNVFATAGKRGVLSHSPLYVRSCSNATFCSMCSLLCELVEGNKVFTLSYRPLPSPLVLTGGYV